MKIDVKMTYQEEYLPSKRHRIPRTREVEEQVSLELREVTRKEAPLAMVVTKYQSYIDENGKDEFGLRDSEYLAIDGQLFSEKRDMSGALDRGAYSMDELLKAAQRAGECRSSWRGQSREDMLRNLNEFVDSHVIVDGIVFKKSGEPRYEVVTFGLGHNHGGTGMFIQTHYNPNIDKDRYFSALQREEALIYANNIAAARGDTKSVGTFGDIDIKVYMPEMVRCNPQMEHGDGDPFMSSIENMIQGTDSAAEAAVLAMAVTAAEISERKASLDDVIVNAEKQKEDIDNDAFEIKKNSRDYFERE